MNEYDQQAFNFLRDTKTTIEKKFLEYGVCHERGDGVKRNIRDITLKNGGGKYTFTFKDSVMNSAKYQISSDPESKWNISLFKKVMKEVDKYNNKNSGSKEIVNLKDCNDVMRKHIFALAWNYTGYWYDNLIKLLEPIAPSDYNILASLDVTYEDNFEDWCDSFGYDTDSKRVEKIYQACIEQDRMLRRLFNTKELELLSDIQ